ncbi:beta-galactosidase [Saccharothrix deserti]|uniref:beta-galactosidase n=1 Tax=Saccharothrix deserti TaxID=2593674 RepID=UPI00192E4916|nr:beta-galactosidase [Saccharothrix deserti]
MREIDATAVPPEPISGHLLMGEAPDHPDAVRVNSRHLSRGGRPWLPVGGEFHFSRYPAAEWREELLKMRAGGITVVSTYVFWIMHEERRGRFRWDGDLDLRRFVVLCGELGLDVVARIGPWAHGEIRNGGFPDWLAATGCVPRTDDPRYLRLVRAFYGQIAGQLAGLLHADGGPVVAVQLDNELHDQPDHLVTLRRMAQEAGLDPPLWTATGWGGARLPPGEVLPVFGGYPEAAWDTAHDGWPAQSRAHYFFRHDRDDDSIGADLRAATSPGGVDLDRYPFATCELGGGMYTSYHRRPVVTAADVAALALVKLGSGSVWQGYYPYHGGSTPIGELSTFQESHATGYPNDCPVVNYDFQAPLGEYGQFRASYAELRRQHLLIADHGADMATMTLRLPADAPPDTTDRDTLRWAVRSDGERGYLFVNNHQPVEPLPEHADVRFAVTLGEQRLVVPGRPATVPSGAHFVWPLNRRVGDITIRTAAAQPLCDLVVDGVPTAVLSQTAAIPVDLLVDAAEVRGPAAVTAEAGHWRVTDLRPGTDCLLELRSPGGSSSRLLILDEAAARTASRGRLWGADRLVLSTGPAVIDADQLTVHGSTDAVLVYPPPGAPTAGVFARIEVPGEAPAPMPARWRLIREAGKPRKPTIDPRSGRASAPTDADFAAATVVHVDIPADAFAADCVLRVDWAGDVGRAYCDGALIADHFWYGPVWEIGLRRHREQAIRHGVDLHLLPLAEQAPIHLSPASRPTAYPDGQVLDLRLITLTPVARTLVQKWTGPESGPTANDWPSSTAKPNPT